MFAIATPFLIVNSASVIAHAVQMSYASGMDHLELLREKIGRLRVEIAHIQQLNGQYRLRQGNVTAAQVAHGQGHERLQQIQKELAQLSALSRKVSSVEQMREKHAARLHLVKLHRQARAFVLQKPLCALRRTSSV